MASQDKETFEIQAADKRIISLTQHEGWGVFKERLTRLCDILENIHNLPADSKTSDKKLLIEVTARKYATNFLIDMIEWAEGAEQNIDISKPISESFIHRE